MKHTNSRKGAALAGTAAIVAGVAFWPAVAGADPSGHRSGSVITGQFTTDRTEEAFIDNDGNGRPSFGDEIIYTNSSQGPLGPGTEYGRCLLHEVTLNAATVTFTTTLNCSSITKIGRNSLTFQGSGRFTLPATGAPELVGPANAAITGGTGRFARARGETTITAIQGRGVDLQQSGSVRVILAP